MNNSILVKFILITKCEKFKPERGKKAYSYLQQF